jgi:four helix bundle protein
LPIFNCRLPIEWHLRAMTPDDLKMRTKRFASAVLKLVDKLPSTITGRVLANQIARSATSVAANYRAACKGRSKAEFVAKLGIVEEEADETQLWLELIQEHGAAPSALVAPLLLEAKELTAIIAASRKSAAGR